MTEAPAPRKKRVRAFFGMPLPDALGPTLRGAGLALRREAARARLELRLVSEENLHVTLKFLGWVDPEDLELLAQRFPRALDGLAPARSGSARLVALPRPTRARVLALEFPEASPALSSAALALERLAEGFGIPPEERAFRAHATLARLARPANVAGLLATPELAPAEGTFDRVRLYESTLSPTGSTYRTLAESRLG